MSVRRAATGPRPGSISRPQPQVTGMLGMSGLTLAIDRIACDGYGSCAELLPEMIALDDWGYPIIRPGPVPVALVEHARMAADTCPILALRLVAAARATMAPAANAPAAGSWSREPVNVARR